jgi:hypothetical protein
MNAIVGVEVEKQRAEALLLGPLLLLILQHLPGPAGVSPPSGCSADRR